MMIRKRKNIKEWVLGMCVSNNFFLRVLFRWIMRLFDIWEVFIGILLKVCILLLGMFKLNVNIINECNVMDVFVYMFNFFMFFLLYLCLEYVNFCRIKLVMFN